jgi:hypothetical protein
MHFLNNLYQSLIDFIKNLVFDRIPGVVHEDELLVRAIVHPLFFSKSKNKLKEGAFLPAPNGTDVSVLRHLYTTDSFCKTHAKSVNVNNNSYCGLATIILKNIQDLNRSQIAKAVVNSTPLDKNYERRIGYVYVGDEGLPMHADVVYDRRVLPGQPNTDLRKYANQLASRAQYFNDPYPASPGWNGGKLSPWVFILLLCVSNSM